jgi:uncharacterized membrane protein
MEQVSGRRLDMGAAIRHGWNRLWPNIVPMGLFTLIVWAVNLVLSGLEGVLLSILGFVVSQLLAIGWIKIALDITDGRPVTASAVTERFGLIGSYLLAALAYTVMVFVGLVLLIVPGIILAIVFAFYGFHIVDTGDRSPVRALRRSAEITRGERGRLFLFGVLLIALNILGLLVLVVGVLVTSAISILAAAYVYRQLSGTAGAAPGEPGQPDASPWQPPPYPAT